jgi:hypothetical protein
MLATPLAAVADQNPTVTGPESASEKAFVASIQADLMKRFPTAADAEKAGYVRYTGVDETGAISYENGQWQSADITHPSQLWYDAKGNLLGADYSVLVSSSAARPNLWGVNPGRWTEFDGHIHWVTLDRATGKYTYDLWMEDPKYVAAGGDADHPTAAGLVAAHKVTDPTQVATVFHFPSIWDLIVWVKPNPKGAFADKNPDVTGALETRVQAAYDAQCRDAVAGDGNAYYASMASDYVAHNPDGTTDNRDKALHDFETAYSDAKTTMCTTVIHSVHETDSGIVADVTQSYVGATDVQHQPIDSEYRETDTWHVATDGSLAQAVVSIDEVTVAIGGKVVAHVVAPTAAP